MKFVKDVVVRTADEILKREAFDMKYHVGTMIEIPRAALTLIRSLRKLSSSHLVQRPDSDDLWFLS